MSISRKGSATAGAVTSVAGRTGDVVLGAGDIVSGEFADPRIKESNVTQHVGAIDHNSLLNKHNLTTDINHNTILNNHNLTSDIDHNTINNNHNLTTDINHNTILNNHNLTSDIDHNTINNGHRLSCETIHFPRGEVNTLQLADTAYYAIVAPLATFSCSAIKLYVTTVGATPSDVDAAIYNAAGTKIASLSSVVTVSATGFLTLTWSSSVVLTQDLLYWVGLAADAGSNTFFLGTNQIIPNDTGFNRSVASSPTVAASLPAGSATSTRCYGRLV